jgi:nucleotide-binding universal stress UspA family protein
MSPGIVVGVDESDGAAAALRWGVGEGRLRGLPVTAVMAWSHAQQHHFPPAPFDPAYGEEDARAALDAIVAAALGPADASAVERRTVCDRAVPALLGEAVGADLLFVGARGLGGFDELLLGSVGQQCLHHAPCPVAVVRGAEDSETSRHVLVGVDGSPPSRAALAWAVEEARLRSARLTVLRAHLPAYVAELPDDGGLVWEQSVAEEAAQAALEAVVDAADTTGVAVDRVLVVDRPAQAILAAAAGADLIVLGSRGLGAFKGMLLGSVSHHVTHRATCPVVVLRSPPGVGEET